MGKNTDEEQNLPGNDGANATARNNEINRCSGCCCGAWIYRYFSFRCVLILAFSAAVFLSALFWLPPFLGLTDRGDLDRDPRFKDHRIVASFGVEKPASVLEDNMLQLENDITGEILFPMTKVVILELERVGNRNRTLVYFAIDPVKTNSKIPADILSLIKAAFQTLVQKQYSFRLTESLFGQPFFFEVLKFPGGITIIPTQPIFPLQKAQIVFNFTLNFSIYQIQTNFEELTSQLKKGINLSPYENLYITLSNTRGSTVAPPTIVHSSVLLAFGTSSRMKQLAQTITSSHSKNLGLNNTVFGKVKQVSLSSIMPHSPAPSPSSPSPSPQPETQHHHQPHHHHHHHHYHHHHHHELAPEPSPATKTKGFAPAPAPTNHSPLRPRNPPCPYEQRTPPKRNDNAFNHHTAPPPKPAPHRSLPHPHPPAPNPTPPRHHAIPVSSPLPHVVFAHIPPPSKTSPESKPASERAPSPSPTTSSASIGTKASSKLLLILAVVIICL